MQDQIKFTLVSCGTCHSSASRSFHTMQSVRSPHKPSDKLGTPVRPSNKPKLDARVVTPFHLGTSKFSKRRKLGTSLRPGPQLVMASCPAPAPAPQGSQRKQQTSGQRKQQTSESNDRLTHSELCDLNKVVKQVANRMQHNTPIVEGAHCEAVRGALVLIGVAIGRMFEDLIESDRLERSEQTREKQENLASGSRGK